LQHATLKNLTHPKLLNGSVYISRLNGHPTNNVPLGYTMVFLKITQRLHFI